ncbi:hypothetical protein SAMN05444920_1011024 [Nonomuraea solani]|uniref:Uncharacterized protein n=1 Tax=Nonomuraea solani TaxID=1144553 RepID=A0A1H5W000_9ACTN|nr:hypothetical protein [Nonomuraea solani]SEF92127.1 hypothetical protein SAMN05444920_1011024 [Nonomuraea solani]
MLSWHPSAEGSDPTYTEPLRLLNLGGVPPEAYADLNACLRSQLQGAENVLRAGATTSVLLTPSGIIKGDGDFMETVADYDVDYHYEDEAVFTALNNLFGQITARAAELRCMALGYKVRMRPVAENAPHEVTISRSTEWQQESPQVPGAIDAVCVDVEHRAGIAFRVFMPYTYQDQRLFLGGLQSVPSQPRVWS